MASMVLAAHPTAARADVITAHVGGCNYGIIIGGDLFPLHWSVLYLNPIRIESAFGGGGNAYFSKAGGSLGFRLPLGNVITSTSNLEFRAGCGLSGGIMHAQEGATYWNTWNQWHFVSYGPFVEPEAAFVLRPNVGKTFFIAGFEMCIPTTYANWNSRNDNWKPGTSFGGFIGFGI
jgi:hypothetical protein